MKKLILTVLTFLSCGATYALPVGNPAEASLICDGFIWEGHCGCDPCDPCLTWCDAFSVRAGFYGDYVFQRFLRNRKAEAPSSARPQLDHSRLWTNAAYLALNFWDRFDLFATLGTTKIWLEGNLTSFSPFVHAIVVDGVHAQLETRNEFSWSVGGRITLWDCGCTSFGVEGQYLRTEPRLSRVTLGEVASIYTTATVPYIRAQYSEWQVGLGVAHRINFLVPYAAVKWTGNKLKWQNNPGPAALIFGTNGITLNDLRNKKFWGYALGLSIVDCEKGAVTAEGRFGDEIGAYVNAQIRF